MAIYIIAERKPQFYSAFPSVPDFGWYSHLNLSDRYHFDDGATLLSYEWRKSFSASDAKNLFSWYSLLLEESGFKLVHAENNLHLLEGYNLSVAIILDERLICVDIKPI